MKICLIRRDHFVFRGEGSSGIDLLGKSTLARMEAEFGQAVREEELPRGEKLVLETAFPFLTRREAEAFIENTPRSLDFLGGRLEREGERVERIDRAPFDGLFTLADLPRALTRAARENAAALLRAGVLIEEGAIVSSEAELRCGCVVERGARVLGRSALGENVVIGTGSEVKDSIIGAGSCVRCSTIFGARVGKNCTIGPYAHLRAGSKVGDGCRIGNFVEIKNASLGAGCKAAHLAYVGDAGLGARVNVGCGVVFVNYDGREKHRTLVGEGAFLGSNCNLVAPVRVGEGAFLAAGTTLTCDLQAGDFCIGRSREQIKEKGAKKYLS